MDSAHCCSLNDVEKGLISMPSSSRGKPPAFDPVGPHASRNAVRNFSRAASVNGSTSFGRMICAFSLPEDAQSCFRKLPASICSCSVPRSALIGEMNPPGDPAEYVRNCTNSDAGTSTDAPVSLGLTSRAPGA